MKRGHDTSRSPVYFTIIKIPDFCAGKSLENFNQHSLLDISGKSKYVKIRDFLLLMNFMYFLMMELGEKEMF